VGTGTATGGSFSIGVTVTDDTTTDFYATATDVAGNVSGCSTSTVSYEEDSTSPAAPTGLATTPSSPANNNSPNVTGSAEAGSTVKLYTNNTCSSSVVGSGTVTGGNFSIGVTVSNDSSTDFYATATDAAGNTSSCSSSAAAYTEDSTHPAIAKSIPGSPVYPSACDSNSTTCYVTSSTSLRVNITEVNGLSSCTISINGPGANDASFACVTGNNDFDLGTPIAGAEPDGSYTISVVATDSAGNTNNDPVTIVLDNTGPSLNKTISVPKYVSGLNTYVKSTTPLSVSSNDGTGSGLASCTLSGDTNDNGAYTPGNDFTLAAPDGAKSWSLSCQDNLGNSTTLNSTAEIVDDTAPSLTKTIGSPNYPSGPNTYVKSTTTLQVTANDGTGSGLASCTKSGNVQSPGAYTHSTDLFLTTPDGAKSWTVSCQDNLGNTANSANSTEIVDDTPPGSYVKTIGNPKYASGMNTYVKATPSVLPVLPATPLSLTANDGSGSGVASCTLSGNTQNNGAYTLGNNFTLSMPDGAKSWTVGCQDNLGNVSSFTSATEIVDDTSPMITVLVPNGAEIFFDLTIRNLTWNCTDSGSGVAPNSIKLEYSLNSGGLWTLIAMNEANDGVYSWLIPDNLDSPNSRIRATCVDNLGNTNSDLSNNDFTLTPGLRILKDDRNLTNGSTSLYRPGDVIEYTVTLTNRSSTIPLFDRSGDEFTDVIGSHPLFLWPQDPAVASSGTIVYNNIMRTYSWNGSIPPLATITLQFIIQIPATPLRAGNVELFCNQATAIVDYNLDGTNESRPCPSVAVKSV